MTAMMKLYLGTHRPTWLTMPGPPLMVSLNTLPVNPKWVAAVPWFLDSGGFTELQQHGRWRTTATEHIERTRRAARLGHLEHASPQDWMCEPAVIAGGQMGPLRFHGTGLSVAEHQQRTVANLVELRTLAPDLPWVPVLQGWTVDDYHRCADLYEAAGVDLAAEQLVGVGSVCRRQAMGEAQDIMRTLSERGYRLHGFGFKQEGIAKCWPWMASADSMAWSYNARAEARRVGSCGRPNGRGGVVKACNHCRHYALDWYDRTVAREGAPIQLALMTG